MGVHLIWQDDEKTVLRQVFVSSWTLEDFRQASETTQKLLNGLPHTVHLILDHSQSEHTPSNILSLIRDLDQYVAENQGTVVVVDADDFLRDMLGVAKRLAPRATENGYFASSLADAMAIITQDTPSKALAWQA